MRVALYARVSTHDKGQNPENHLILLRRETERAGDFIIREYVDQESGGTAGRRQFRQLLHAAEERKFDLVRFFALDRFNSEGFETVFEYTPCLGAVRRCLWEVLRADAQHLGYLTIPLI